MKFNWAGLMGVSKSVKRRILRFRAFSAEGATDEGGHDFGGKELRSDRTWFRCVADNIGRPRPPWVKKLIEQEPSPNGTPILTSTADAPPPRILIPPHIRFCPLKFIDWTLYWRPAIT